MGELPAVSPDPLLEALEALHRLIAQDSSQPLVQLAEGVVLHWHRVLDGHELVQPRLVPEGFLPTAFHFGMEPRADNRLDDAGIGPGGAGFADALADRQQALARALEDYFAHPGYRSSSDQCDRMMVEVARFSRFVGTWALEAELLHRQRWKGRKAEPGQHVNVYERPESPTLLWRTRWNLAFWEPHLNAALSAWEANTLEAYDAALRELQGALAMAEGERRLHPPGYPLRALERYRLKVAVLDPEPKPLRTRSVLWVRFNQLLERIRTAMYLDAEQVETLLADVQHFARMVESNHFMLTFEAGFQARGRPGVQVIRGRPSTHPILLDAHGFFKKAVLFHNGTYTVAGGGLDLMYLQLRQLERFFRFESWAAPWRHLRGPLEASLIGWEENKWETFVEGLLHVADLLRGDAS